MTLSNMVDVVEVEVDADNWRACAAVHPNEEQKRWVADVTYYLCVCLYGDSWHPLAIEADGKIVGFLMWGVDDDASRWIGGLVVDAASQGRGIGKAAVVQAVRLLIAQEGCTGVALSYGPDNTLARSLYERLGFVQTDETADDGAELVSRLSMGDALALTTRAGPPG